MLINDSVCLLTSVSTLISGFVMAIFYFATTGTFPMRERILRRIESFRRHELERQERQQTVQLQGLIPSVLLTCENNVSDG